MLRRSVVEHLLCSVQVTMHSIVFNYFCFSPLLFSFFFVPFFFSIFIQKHNNTQGTHQQLLIKVAFHFCRLESLHQNKVSLAESTPGIVTSSQFHFAGESGCY